MVVWVVVMVEQALVAVTGGRGTRCSRMARQGNRLYTACPGSLVASGVGSSLFSVGRFMLLAHGQPPACPSLLGLAFLFPTVLRLQPKGPPSV